MKYPVMVLLLLIAIIAGAEQQKPIITVLDLKVNNVSESDMKSIVTFLSAELFETGAYTVIDSSQRDALLSELEFSLSGCTDESCQLEVGKMLAAEYIVVGDIGKLGDRFVITVKILDTETSETVKTARKVYNSMNDLVDDLKNIALALADEKTPIAVAESAADETASDKEEEGNSDIAENINQQVPNKKKVSSKTTGAILMGGGAALLAGGVLFTLDAIDKYNKDGGVKDLYAQYQNAPDMYDLVDDGDTSAYEALDQYTQFAYIDGFWSAYSDALDAQRISGILGIALLGSGLAAGITGVIIYFTPKKPPAEIPEKPAAQLSGYISPLGAGINISF